MDNSSELVRQCKDWLKHLPAFEQKVKVIGAMMDCQLMIGKSFTPEQQEKFKDIVRESRDV